MFKHKFFSRDKKISNLCKIIFRLRKICAFCRTAKQYEKHENGKTIAGGDTEKIKELRDSINPQDDTSKFLLVPAANMQHGANEFLVSALPCVSDVDNVNDVNQLFVCDLSLGDQMASSLASSLASSSENTADIQPSENKLFV
jgi:hypothetical protein